jgi:hypothetical protein
MPAPRGDEIANAFFFILLGLILLGCAYGTLAIGVHTSFSFVLVVLGVAILLFGTGTQGVGKFESSTTAAKVNGAIAGGAGLLALAVGYGMAVYGSDMQRAFGVETHYVVVKLLPNNDGASSFVNYWAEFSIDGEPIPSVRRGDVLLAFVPYSDIQKNAVKRVTYHLRPHDPRVLSANFKQTVEDRFEVPIAQIDRFNGGVDFPTYDKIAPIDMRSTANTNVVLKAASDRTLQKAEGAADPDPTAPATLVVQ